MTVNVLAEGALEHLWLPPMVQEVSECSGL